MSVMAEPFSEVFAAALRGEHCQVSGGSGRECQVIGGDHEATLRVAEIGTGLEAGGRRRLLLAAGAGKKKPCVARTSTRGPLAALTSASVGMSGR